MFWHRKPRDRHLLRAIYSTTCFIHERLTTMSKAQDDLTAAVGAIQTAVGDATGAIKDLAAQLASASSVNPADVETAAAKLNQIAAGLEAAVSAAGEPVTPPPAPAPVVDPAPEPAVAADPVVDPTPVADPVADPVVDPAPAADPVA